MCATSSYSMRLVSKDEDSPSDRVFELNYLDGLGTHRFTLTAQYKSSPNAASRVLCLILCGPIAKIVQLCLLLLIHPHLEKLSLGCILSLEVGMKHTERSLRAVTRKNTEFKGLAYDLPTTFNYPVNLQWQTGSYRYPFLPLRAGFHGHSFKVALQRFIKNYFATRVASTWNHLHVDIIATNCIAIFKRKLSCFKWPPEYSTRLNLSL